MQAEASKEQEPGLRNFVAQSDMPGSDLPSSQSDISLVAVMKTLQRNQRQLLVTTLVVFLIVTAVAFLIPSTYTATASFVPPQSSSGGLGAVASQLSSVGLGAGALLGATKNNGDLYVGMLGSHTVGAHLVSRFHLMQVYNVSKESKAISRLFSRSTFELGVRDGIVTIKVSDRSPERARDLANAYLDELHGVNDRLAITDASQRRLFFEQQLAHEKDRLADAEVGLKQVEEKTGVISPTGQTQVGLTTVAQTRAAIASRQVQLAGLKFSATDQDPEVVRLHDEIRELQGQLTSLQRGASASNSVDIPSSKVPQVQLELVRQEREVKYHEALFEMISKQYEVARLDESRDAPVLQVLDQATVPDTRSGPPRAAIIALGFVLGLVIGALRVLLADRSWKVPSPNKAV